MANTIMAKPGREGYKILFNENTVIMNYKFAAAAAKYGTKENTLLKNIRTDFPGMTEVVVSGRVQTTAKANHRLTYANMEKYIRCFDNSDVLLKRFETVKDMSLTLKSPYKFVCDWFLTQFPDYKETPEFEDNLTVVKFVPYPDKNKYQEKAVG